MSKTLRKKKNLLGKEKTEVTDKPNPLESKIAEMQKQLDDLVKKQPKK